MNVLIGSNVHWWNAEAAYAAVTAEQLQRAGHRVYVLTRPDTANATQLQKRNLPLVTHIDLNSYNPFRLIQAYHQLYNFVQDHQIDIINAHRSEGLFLYALLRQRHPHFKLIRTRGTTRPVRGSRFNRKLYGDWIDSHIFAGDVVQSRTLQAVNLPESKRRVIYYPVDLPALPVKQNAAYREEFQIPDGAKILAIVGRTNPVKGHALLFESLRQLLQHAPDTVLLVCYKHPDPQHPHLLSLQQKVRELEIGRQVRFIGPRDDIRAIMEFADVGVVSSVDSEVICRVAVEFFSVGTPVVAFPTGCLPEIIRPNLNGVLIDTPAIDALSEGLQGLLLDERQLTLLKQGARSDAEKRFSYDHFLAETLEVFESVVG